MNRKFNFELAILSMNAMYELPIAQNPSLLFEATWQLQHFPNETLSLSRRQLVMKRLVDFFGEKSILRNELDEYGDIWNALQNPDITEVDVLVMLADLLADIQIYCASEMARFGLPNQEILQIVMESNASKLGADGKPIYNEQGKFMKGPNYWPPEPKIRELIQQLRKDAGV